jgi:hypothetical protein
MPPLPDHDDLLIAAHRAVVVQTAARWLLHELRTPLQGVTLLSDIVAESDPDLLDPALVVQLAEGGRRLAGSIEQLDHLLRPLPLERDPEPVSLADAARQVASLLACRRGARPPALDDALGALPAVAGVEEVVVHLALTMAIWAMEGSGESDGAIRIGGRPAGGVVELLVTGPADPAATSDELGLRAAALLAARCGGTVAPGGGGMVLRLRRWG